MTIVSGKSSDDEAPCPSGSPRTSTASPPRRTRCSAGGPRGPTRRASAPRSAPRSCAGSACSRPSRRRSPSRGRVWGAIAIARRSQEPLPPTTETRLGDFAELAAQAIANADAREQLAASRARIVQAGDEERRRHRAQPPRRRPAAARGAGALAAHAQTALADDPRAADLLAQASGSCSSRCEELRELARGIHPAVLATAASPPRSRRSPGGAPCPSTSRLPQERLPEQVEATAYYLVAESLTNVAKYAEATEASVSVRREGDRLHVEVRDDGVGGADIEAGRACAVSPTASRRCTGRCGSRARPGPDARRRGHPSVSTSSSRRSAKNPRA